MATRAWMCRSGRCPRPMRCTGPASTTRTLALYGWSARLGALTAAGLFRVVCGHGTQYQQPDCLDPRLPSAAGLLSSPNLLLSFSLLPLLSALARPKASVRLGAIACCPVVAQCQRHLPRDLAARIWTPAPHSTAVCVPATRSQMRPILSIRQTDCILTHSSCQTV